MSNRQIVLDTETTGLEAAKGHKIIEIGCVEIIDREITDSHFHYYLDPQREIDEGAVAVHGLTSQFLKGKPLFSSIVHELLSFLKGAELIIHNAVFDVGFLNWEINLLNQNLGRIEDYCNITDTLELARKKYPGQKNSLDALCKRLQVDNSSRELHGALLDAKLLAMVYLSMTGGQSSIFDMYNDLHLSKNDAKSSPIQNDLVSSQPMRIIKASNEELALHEQTLMRIDESSNGQCLWKKLQNELI